MSSARPRLTREAVLGAALRVIDQSGLDACTMRAVASELGVEAMSLYWHVPSKDALLDGVVEQLLVGLDVDPAPDGDWVDVLRASAWSFRSAVLSHRNALPLIASRPLGAYVRAGRMTDRALERLEAAGFDRRTAIRATRAIARYVVGFTLGERGPGADPPPPSTSPALDELLAAVAADDPDELFAFGLELLLAGLGSRLRQA